MRQTVNQFMATIKKLQGVPDDMDYQVNAWPYPQTKQSHIAIYRKSWERSAPHMLPNRQIVVMLDYSDEPGRLMRIRVGEPTPKEVVKMLLEGRP